MKRLEGSKKLVGAILLFIVVGCTTSCNYKIVKKTQLKTDLKMSYNRGYSKGRSFGTKNIEKVIARTRVNPKANIVVDPATLDLTNAEIQFVKDLYAENLALQAETRKNLVK